MEDGRLQYLAGEDQAIAPIHVCHQLENTSGRTRSQGIRAADGVNGLTYH